MATGHRKLLLADDSVTIQKVISLTFSDEGLEVRTVSDGAEAVAQVEHDPPDIVLADVHMPKLSGYQVCERIKNDARFRHIPVLLLVGTFESFNEAEARRVGADDVLTKPFQSIRNLVNKVGSLLGSQPEGENAQTDAAQPRDSEPDVTPRHDIVMHDAHADVNRATETAHADEAQPVAVMWEQDDDTTLDEPGDAAHVSTVQAAPEISFADIGMDDQMIEATPVPDFGHERPHEAPFEELSFDAPQEAAASPTEDFVIGEFGTSSDVMQENSNVMQDEPLQLDFDDPLALDDEEPAAHAYEPQPQVAAQPAAFEPQFSAVESRETWVEPEVREEAAPVGFSAVEPDFGSDDALLDLGDIDAAPPAPAISASDDSILDLGDDELTAESAPVMPLHAAAPPVDELEEFKFDLLDTGASDVPPADYAGAFAEAAHGTTPEPTPNIFAPVAETFEPQPLAASAFSGEAVSQSESVPQTAGGKVTLDQLSPEVIDAIARRVVEQMSERVVREIAWEVVPQLSELLIRQRLEEEKSHR